MGPHALARGGIDKISVEKKVLALCLLMAIVQKPQPHRHLEENVRTKCSTAEANWLQLPQPFKMEPMQKKQYKLSRDEHLLAERYSDNKDIYFLSKIHMMKEVPIGKLDKEWRSVKTLQLVITIKKWKVWIKKMPRLEVIVGSVNHISRQQKRFSILLKKSYLIHWFHIKNVMVKNAFYSSN